MKKENFRLFFPKPVLSSIWNKRDCSYLPVFQPELDCSWFGLCWKILVCPKTIFIFLMEGEWLAGLWQCRYSCIHRWLQAIALILWMPRKVQLYLWESDSVNPIPWKGHWFKEAFPYTRVFVCRLKVLELLAKLRMKVSVLALKNIMSFYFSYWLFPSLKEWTYSAWFWQGPGYTQCTCVSI